LGVRNVKRPGACPAPPLVKPSNHYQYDRRIAMKHKIRIFDNKGETFDRYTVLIDEDAFGMSHNPLSAQGFNQYIGFSKDIKIDRKISIFST
jgi:hypothetical protein